MRRAIIVTVTAAISGMAGWSASASAQSVEIYVGPPAAYDTYYDYRPYRSYYYAPPAYGYSYRRDRHLDPPEYYRPGSRRWWRQMDRTGRGGGHN
jgi:hypothetical protein